MFTAFFWYGSKEQLNSELIVIYARSSTAVRYVGRYPHRELEKVRFPTTLDRVSATLRIAQGKVLSLVYYLPTLLISISSLRTLRL